MCEYYNIKPFFYEIHMILGTCTYIEHMLGLMFMFDVEVWCPKETHCKVYFIGCLQTNIKLLMIWAVTVALLHRLVGCLVVCSLSRHLTFRVTFLNITEAFFFL